MLKALDLFSFCSKNTLPIVIFHIASLYKAYLISFLFFASLFIVQLLALINKSSFDNIQPTLNIFRSFLDVISDLWVPANAFNKWWIIVSLNKMIHFKLFFTFKEFVSISFLSRSVLAFFFAVEKNDNKSVKNYFFRGFLLRTQTHKNPLTFKSCCYACCRYISTIEMKNNLIRLMETLFKYFN